MVSRFSTNNTSLDFFNLLDKDSTSILIGGMDVVYNLSMTDLAENVDEVRNTRSCCCNELLPINTANLASLFCCRDGAEVIVVRIHGFVSGINLKSHRLQNNNNK